jgi:hypothetical protein
MSRYVGSSPETAPWTQNIRAVARSTSSNSNDLRQRRRSHGQMRYVMGVAQRRTPPQLRKLARIASACAALFVALVVLVDVAQAGRSYIYCSAMQEVMAHSCCQQHQASSSTPLLTNAKRECCQDHVVPKLGAWTAFEQQTLVAAAPWFAIVARPLFQSFAVLGLQLRPELPLNRSGPALLRVLAQLMVFRL